MTKNQKVWGAQATSGNGAQAGAMVRHELGATQVEMRSELGTGALAAREQALVHARAALAKQFPRNMAHVRASIMAECQRPGFADEAVYRRPVGRKKNEATGRWEDELAEGLSIRFAEDAKRLAGNIHVSSIVWAEDFEKRIIRVSAMDLETNTTEEVDVVVWKIIERKDPKDREIVGERTNTYGEKVFQVVCTPDELTTKANAEVAKARRNKILELLPADLKTEALTVCKTTLAEAAAQELKDPKGTRQKILLTFGKLGVSEASLVAWLGKELVRVTATELVDLRMVAQALQGGETTWDAVMEARTGIPQRRGPQAPPPSASSATPPAPAPSPAPPATPEASGQEERDKPDEEHAGQEPPEDVPLPTGNLAPPPEPVQAELLTATPAPVATAAPTTEPAEPPVGTPEFSTWLEARMRDAKTVDELSALAKRSGHAPQADQKRFGSLFLTLRTALKKSQKETPR